MSWDEDALFFGTAFPLKVLRNGESWVSGVVLADAEGHPICTFGEGEYAEALAEWFADAANAQRYSTRYQRHAGRREPLAELTQASEEAEGGYAADLR